MDATRGIARLILHPHFAMPSPASSNYRAAILGGLWLALSAALTPVTVAEGLGYLRVSGPSPIRFRASKEVLATTPAACSPPNAADWLPSAADPAQEIGTSSTVKEPVVPALSEPHAHAPANTRSQPGLASNPSSTSLLADPPLASPTDVLKTADLPPTSASSAPQIPAVKIPQDATIIAPQTILPLLLDDASAPAGRVTVVAPISFVPPQPGVSHRSTASYSVTP